MLASLETLPPELLYRICDDLDVETIVVSLRQVCRLFRSIIQTYNRYVFDFQWITKSNLNLICRIIPPENVISLILTNNKTPGQIDFFLSLVRISKFNRLRYLTLQEVDESHVVRIITRLKVDQLRSLVIKIEKYDERRKRTTEKLLSSVISQSNLWKLDLHIEPDRFSSIQWVQNCMIRDLSIDALNNLSTIMECCPHMRALTLRKLLPFMNKSICFKQLTSLTIDDIYATMNELESFLLSTPSLVHLKMNVQIDVLDGTRWEQFIQINLPMLNKLEFYLVVYERFPQTDPNIEFIITSFRSLFWIEYKKWFVTCEYDINDVGKINLYTLPICTTTINYIPSSERISLSTASNLSSMDNIKNVIVSMTKTLADEIEEKETMIINPVFRKVTKLTLNLADDCQFIPLNSLSTLVDLSTLVEIEFKNCFFDVPNTNPLSAMITLIQQTPNLLSLKIHQHFVFGFGLYTEDICYILSHQIRHLQIPIDHIDDLKVVFEQCNHISSFQFDIRQSKFSREIVRWIDDNTMCSTYRTCANFVQVWRGKNNQIEASDESNVEFKRIKLSE